MSDKEKEALRDAFIAGAAMGRGETFIGFEAWFQQYLASKGK